MAGEKNCAFQYATPRNILEDTDLITAEEAGALWAKYVPKFKADLIDGREPEMAIWVDMETSGDYRKTSKHWCASEFTVIDGRFFIEVNLD